jgi:hypothetical protein
MAVQQQQQLPPQYVEDLQTDYGKQLTGLTTTPLDTSKFAPQVAGQDPFQTQAYNLAGSGVGAYQPYLTQGAGYDTGAAGYSGPSGYSSFMSPYQTDVIDATMAQYDQQAGRGLQGIADQATKSGNLGGGREGVQRAQYQSQSDLNRALLQSGLLQQGFSQAQGQANNAFNQQLQLGQNQYGLAQLLPSLQQSDIGSLGAMGATQQAQEQAQLGATAEAARLKAYEPYERLGYQGQGIASIASGAPGQYQSSVMPNPTPLQTALSAGTVLSGIYGNVMGPYRNRTD